jgi:molybdate transport system substrate-binding protein
MLPLFGCAIVLVAASLTAPSACAAQQPRPAVELHIDAAADLQPVLPTLAAAYEHATGVKLNLSFASSGTLTTQILNGAPVDVFLGADFIFPEKVVAAGLAEQRNPVPYAHGALVLWTRKDSPFHPLSVDSLTDPRVKSIAIADQLHAPYGRAAVSAMQKLGIYDKAKPHLVIAENVAQAGQFAESGNAQLGLISLTLASSPHFKQIGDYVLIPTMTYPEIRQCAVVLSKSEHRTEANAFLTWLLSEKVQSQLPSFGLNPVH